MNPRTGPTRKRCRSGETGHVRTRLAASRTAVAEASLAAVLVHVDLGRHAIMQLVGSVAAAIVSLIALFLHVKLTRIRFVAAGAVVLAVMVLAHAAGIGSAAA